MPLEKGAGTIPVNNPMPHQGKPIFMLALLACVSGLAVLARPATPRADLTVWVFAEDEAETFRQAPPDGGISLIQRFAKSTGSSVQVDLIAQRALDARLMSLFMSDDPTADTPDLVEIDMASVGKYFRPPTGDVGLLPLNGFLADSKEMENILPSRLAPWSKGGLIFGLPRDVHPVTLTYRKDLFDQAGVDLEAARTWPEFQEKCLQFQRYWSEHGSPGRMALELFTTQSEELLLMLMQQQVNLVDERNRIELADPKVAQTLAFYAQLVAGPRRIAADTIPGTAFGYRDLADGNVCAMLTPDWRAAYLKQYAPELAGKVRMMPLPVFDQTDAPTSTWGGTMIGIPRRARNPGASWKLLEFLCLSPEGLEARRRYSEIIPPLKNRWNDAVYQSGDPFFGGQPIDRLYIELAGQIPTRYVTPISINAQAALSVVLNRAVGYVNEHGQENLQGVCAGWLAEAAAQVRQWVSYGDFDR